MEKSHNGEENEKFKEDASICGYDSLHHLLKENLKPHHFKVTYSTLKLKPNIIYTKLTYSFLFITFQVLFWLS
jgi:hypothetical protein